MKDIQAVAQALGIPGDAAEPRLHGVLKVDPERFTTPQRGRVVLVTAMTPTPAGEGKTTTVIGLVDGLRQRGVNVVGALREPSLGPVFGAKGGAVGGGAARVVPEDAINLHFTGDIHAVTTAHNLLAAMVDNHVFHRSAPFLAAQDVTFGRVLDMNDRALRKVTVGLAGKDAPQHTSRFDITAASEVMAILCLSHGVADLRARLDRVVVGRDGQGRAITARDVGAAGAMAALLLDACRPNLVQTREGSPVFVHGGPFGNVAQGTSSLMQTQLCRRLADVVVTEAGFAFDLGGFKFLDLKGRVGNFRPAAVVLVVTVRALRFHGGAADHTKVDEAAVARGLENVAAHLESMARLGLPPPVVAINRFPDDSPAELRAIETLCAAHGATAVEATHFAHGGAGAAALAGAVMEVLEGGPQDSPGLKLPYSVEEPLEAKVDAVARVVLGARDVAWSAAAREDEARLRQQGLTAGPICLAKTHLSISDNAALKARPPPFTLQVTGVRASAGAGFVVVLCGPILTMPGLLAAPAAQGVDVQRDTNGTWHPIGLH